MRGIIEVKEESPRDKVEKSAARRLGWFLALYVISLVVFSAAVYLLRALIL